MFNQSPEDTTRGAVISKIDKPLSAQHMKPWHLDLNKSCLKLSLLNYLTGSRYNKSKSKRPSKTTKIEREPDFFFMDSSKGLIGAPQKHSARKTKTFSSLNLALP